jgi:hypothetical protein
LREKGRGSKDGEHCDGCRNDGEAGDPAHADVCVYLLSLLLFRRRFPHKFRHDVFSFTKSFPNLINVHFANDCD